MRIVSGRYRRRKLLSNPGMTTRPITDRAKVRLFDRIDALNQVVPGRRVIDIFSGTGTLGLEALSRGALSVVFIERDHRANELLQQNIDALHVPEDQVLCWRTDATRCSYQPKGNVAWHPYGLIFLDPPYVLAEQELKPGHLLYRGLIRLARPEVSVADVRLVLRLPVEMEFPWPECWTPRERLIVGSMQILIAYKAEYAATLPPLELVTEELGDDVDQPLNETEADDDDPASPPDEIVAQQSAAEPRLLASLVARRSLQPAAGSAVSQARVADAASSKVVKSSAHGTEFATGRTNRDHRHGELQV